VFALLHIIQDTIRTPQTHDQGAEQQSIEQEESAHVHWWKAHEGKYIRYGNRQEYLRSDSHEVIDFRCPPYAAVQPENVQDTQLHHEDSGKDSYVPVLECRAPGQVILQDIGSPVCRYNQHHIGKAEEEAAIEYQRFIPA